MKCTCSYNYLRLLGFPETAIRHSVVCRVRNEATQAPENLPITKKDDKIEV